MASAFPAHWANLQRPHSNFEPSVSCLPGSWVKIYAAFSFHWHREVLFMKLPACTPVINSRSKVGQFFMHTHFSFSHVLIISTTELTQSVHAYRVDLLILDKTKMSKLFTNLSWPKGDIRFRWIIFLNIDYSSHSSSFNFHIPWTPINKANLP